MSEASPKPEPGTNPVVQEAPSPEAIQNCLRVMEALKDEPALLIHISPEDRIRLMKAAGHIAHPTINETRRTARAARKVRREQRNLHNRQTRRNTGIRQARKIPVFQAPKQIEEMPEEGAEFNEEARRRWSAWHSTGARSRHTVAPRLSVLLCASA